MADHRHHLRRALTVLAGTFGAALMMFSMAPNALAACEDAKEQAEKPGKCVDPPDYEEGDEEERCNIWFDGQVYMGSGNRLPVDKEPLPPDRLQLYALVSPCDGGPAPPNQNAYDCAMGDSGTRWEDYECDPSEPRARLYQIWSRYYDEAEPEWQPSTEWELEPWACLSPDQGAAHEYLPADQPWITYIASYPGGDLQMEPPGGTTMINFETNFYTEAPKEIRYSAEHNSGPVKMCAEPTQWVWDFGDKKQLVTDTPGAPFPNPQVTHKYEKKGPYEPSVSIRYTRYLNSFDRETGEWRGWVTNDLLHDSLPGQGVPLETVELMPRLVSPNEPPP